MNASCALQHFCDIDGPRILLCTETKTYIPDVNDNDDEDLKTFYSQYIKSKNPQQKNECKSCTLSPDGVLVSTIDIINRMVYISSSSTPNQQLYRDIQNAGRRSLSSEKSAEVGTPILFGNDEDGYCLSLAFSCKDFHARGSQRLYSLCYLCYDKYHLVSLMKLLSDCLRQVVYWLQHDANETYEQEGRIKLNTNLNRTSIATTTYIIRTPPRVPSQRMLSDIVHDSNLTYRIHALFVWFLRTAISAMNESLFDALPTEEEATKQERKDILDNETSVLKSSTATSISPTQDSLIISPILPNTHNHLSSSIYSTGDSYHQNGNGFDDDDDDDDLFQYQFSSYRHEALKIFQVFIKKLDNIKYLQYILHNWSIGNRLIIKYTNRMDNNDLIHALTSVFRLFLPDGCFHLTEATNQITTCTANCILFNTDLNLTDDMLLSLTENSNDNKTIIIKIILDDSDDNIHFVKLETLPEIKTEIPISTYVKTILDLLTDDYLNEEVFESIITQHKIKYLNKAKLHFQFRHCQTSTISSPNDQQQMKIFNVDNISDLKLIRFWQQGLSQAYKKQIRILKQDVNQQQRTQSQ